jgi:hypothetical protein
MRMGRMQVIVEKPKTNRGVAEYLIRAARSDPHNAVWINEPVLDGRWLRHRGIVL